MPISLVQVSAGLIHMRSWQRLVAAFLLLAFVPASVAAALPLVFCLGADGHRAIELVQSTPHHAVQDSRAEADGLHGSATVDLAGGCVDFKIISSATVSQRSVDFKPTLSKTPLTGAKLFSPAVQSRSLPIGRGRGPHVPFASRAGNHLAVHRTVVLLI
jgi:hypothetical protein